MAYLKMKQPCLDYSSVIIVIIVFILCVSGIAGYYLYIEHQVKMLTKEPEKKNKITINILAAGFTMAYAAMLMPTAKETLDFIIYGLKVELYSLTKALIFLGMIVTGLVTGGTAIASKIKGKQ